MENALVWFLLLYTNPLVAVPLPGITTEAQCQDIAAHTFFGNERGAKKPDFICVDITKKDQDKPKPSGDGAPDDNGRPVGPDGKMQGGGDGM